MKTEHKVLLGGGVAALAVGVGVYLAFYRKVTVQTGLGPIAFNSRDTIYQEKAPGWLLSAYGNVPTTINTLSGEITLLPNQAMKVATGEILGVPDTFASRPLKARS